MSRLSPNARAHDDAKIITTEREARQLCSGGATGWKATRSLVMRRDRDKSCCRCGGPIRWDVPGNQPQGPSLDHLGTKVADVVGMTKGATRKLLHDTSQLAISHFACNPRDARGHDRPPTENYESTNRVTPPEPLNISRKSKNGFVTPDGRTIYRGPNYTQEDYERECERFTQYARNYRTECVRINAKPPVLSEDEWQRWIAEVQGNAA